MALLNTFDLDAFVALLGSGNGAVYVKYTWNAENRLTAVIPPSPQAGERKVDFAYDYLGRRIEKRVYTWNDTSEQWDLTARRKFVWAGWLVLAELDGSDAVVRKYTWGLDLAGQSGNGDWLGSGADVPVPLSGAGGISGLLAVHDATVSGGEDYVFTYDANGNVGQVLDLGAATVNDAIVARYEYDPYANVVGPDTNADGVFNDQDDPGAYADENPWRFSTKYWDDETGLGYWGYRYYSPRLGRWMSRDPIAEQGGTHLYAYDGNSATGGHDAIGLSSSAALSCCCDTDGGVPATQPCCTVCSGKNCRWQGQVTVKAWAVILGFAQKAVVSARAFDDTGCLYQVWGTGNQASPGGGTGGIGWFNLSGSFSNLPAPCKWPISKGNLVSVGFATLLIPTGSIVDLPINALHFSVGRFTFFEAGGVGGINLNLGGGFSVPLDDDVTRTVTRPECIE